MLTVNFYRWTRFLLIKFVLDKLSRTTSRITLFKYSKASCIFWEWFALFDYVGHKKIVWNKQKIIYLPIRISHDKKMRIAQRCNPVNHRRICSICNFMSYCRRFAFLALQLKVRFTFAAVKISNRPVCLIGSQYWCTTNRAVHIPFHPILG